MNIPFIKKQSSVVVGVAFLTLGTAISATAATFNPAPLFNQVQEPPKSLITITGTNHFGITNDNNPAGIVFDPNTQTLDKDAGIETIARWSALFLRGNVLGDEGALEYVNQVGDTLDTNVSVISQTQGVPEPTSTLGILSFGAFGLGSWLWRKCIAKNY